MHFCNDNKKCPSRLHCIVGGKWIIEFTWKIIALRNFMSIMLVHGDLIVVTPLSKKQIIGLEYLEFVSKKKLCLSLPAALHQLSYITIVQDHFELFAAAGPFDLNAKRFCTIRI